MSKFNSGKSKNACALKRPNNDILKNHKLKKDHTRFQMATHGITIGTSTIKATKGFTRPHKITEGHIRLNKATHGPIRQKTPHKAKQTT